MMYEDYYVTQKKATLEALIRANGMDFSKWNMSDHCQFISTAKELRKLGVMPKKIWRFYKEEWKWHQFENVLDFIQPYIIRLLLAPLKVIINLIKLIKEK